MTSGIGTPGEGVMQPPGDELVCKDPSSELTVANGGMKCMRKLPEKMPIVRVPERNLGLWAI